MSDLGEHYGAGLTQAEVNYLVAQEWARHRRGHSVASDQARACTCLPKPAAAARQRWDSGSAACA